jgi:hypothetical protein
MNEVLHDSTPALEWSRSVGGLEKRTRIFHGSLGGCKADSTEELDGCVLDSGRKDPRPEVLDADEV